MHRYLSLYVTSWWLLAVFDTGSASAIAPERTSQKLIMSLDVPSDQVPEYLCIVSTSRVCPKGSEDANNNLLHENDCFTRELSDLQSIGSLPADLSGDDVAIRAPAPGKDTVVRYHGSRKDEVTFASVPDLWNALQSLSRGRQETCEQEHHGCAPRVRLTKFARAGRIVCGSDPSNHNGRVAIVELSYHLGETRSGVQEVQLQGTSATLRLDREVPALNVAQAAVLGGDYVFSPTASLGTHERIAVTLRPRCTLVGMGLPTHSATLRLVEATIQLDPWRSLSRSFGAELARYSAMVRFIEAAIHAGMPEASRKRRSIVTRCIPTPQQDVLPINIPYRDEAGTKRLVVATAAARSPNSNISSRSDDQATTILESIWNGSLPSSTPRLGFRRFEFSWHRDCLVGQWSPLQGRVHDDSSNGICPRATIDESFRCSIIVQPDTATCKYRCEVDDANPPLLLPIGVRFDRIVHYDQDQEQLLYSWHDTLSFSGQELSSSVDPRERKVIVQISEPDAWKSRPGNEVERAEVRSGSLDHQQTIFIGDAPPAWTTIAAPEATCTSRFAVDIIGARSFARRDLSLEPTGNLVLPALGDFWDVFHLTLLIGGGFLFPQNEPLGKPRGELHGTIGAGGEIYLANHFPDAFEFGVIYEPGYIAYGAIPNPQTMDQSKISVPYQRLMLEFAGTYWGHNRTWQVGLMGGGGAGGPIFGETEKVGGFHKFIFGGALARWHFFPSSLHAAIELDGGVRWGEAREYFGTTEAGDPNDARFHGEPAITELRLLQLYVGFRWRISLR